MQLATFELKLTVIDKPTTRRRWNGGPLASPDADAALNRAVEAFETVIREARFEVIRTGYGVSARDVQVELKKIPQIAEDPSFTAPEGGA